MLITSRMVRERCPICRAEDCTCGGPSDVVPVDERVVMASTQGPLLRFPVGRGASIRLREETARRRGLLPPKPEEPERKRRSGSSTKIRRPGSNK